MTTPINPSDLNSDTTITTSTEVLTRNGDAIERATFSEVISDLARNFAVAHRTSVELTASDSVDNTSDTCIVLNNGGAVIAATLDNAPAQHDIIEIKVTAIDSTHTVACPSGSTWVDGATSGQTLTLNATGYLRARCITAGAFEVLDGSYSGIA